MFDPVTIAAGIIVGVIVGLLSGLLGIGGGTMMIPVFKFGFGLPALTCTATSLFTIIPTSISGTVTHLKNKTCIIKIGLAAGLGGAAMSPVGVWLANLSPDWATMVAAAIVIAYSAVTMFRKALAMGRPGEPSERGGGEQGGSGQGGGKPSGGEQGGSGQGDGEQGEGAGPAIPAADAMLAISAKQVIQAVAIGLVAGILAGYVGVGGGFIMVPMMIQLFKIPMKVTSGTSLFAVMIIAIPGVIAQAIFGNVDFIAGICMAIGSIPGAILGATLSDRVPERILRFMFSAMLIIVAIMLVIDQL